MAIEFDEDGASLRPDGLVEGFAATAQAIMVNVGTMAGSDPLYPGRGTDLLRDGVEGRLVDTNTAQHRANFAALDTRTFFQELGYLAGEPSLRSLAMGPAALDAGILRLDLRMVSSTGEEIGITTENN